MGRNTRLGKINAFRDEVYRQRDKKVAAYKHGKWNQKTKKFEPVEKITIDLNPEVVLFILDALEGAYLALEDTEEMGWWFDEYFPFEVEQ